MLISHSQVQSRSLAKLIACFAISFSMSAALTAEEFVQNRSNPSASARGSVINTTYNTSYKEGRWTATMGPLTDFFGGLACDHRAMEKGDGDLYRKGDYAVWFIAPSDAIQMLGLKHCGPNPYGGEPSCQENWDFCGRKIRLSCQQGNAYCASPGSPSLLADINSGRGPKNNYIPDYYVQRTVERVGTHPSVPQSVILYITDFCPKDHSENSKSGNCQGPQVDVSTPAFLLLARQSNGYINGDVPYQVELLDAGDQTPAGPQWTASAPFPFCTAQNGRGYGNSWTQGQWTLAKDSPNLEDSSICVVSTH